MEKINEYCLYRHLKPDGCVFYVGISKNIKRPYNKHGRTKYWKNIVNKYGYEVQILKTHLSKEQACELEMILISWYGRIDLHNGTLVNMTDGTLAKSAETRRKISESQLGSKNHMFGKTGNKNPNYGNRWSEEQKLKASIKLKNRYKNSVNPLKGRRGVISEETRRKISENANKPCNCEHYFSKEVINMQTGVVHCSSSEASDTYGIKNSTLRSMLNGTNKNRTDLRYLENV